MATALDWVPQLSTAQEVLCMAGAALVCAVLWASTMGPPGGGFHLGYATGMGAVFGVLTMLMRNALLERMYQVGAMGVPWGCHG